MGRLFGKIIVFVRAMGYVLRAPLNRGHGAAALLRVARWQLSSRLAPGDLVVPFVGDTVLIGRPSLTGMTLNVYCGLAETDEMGFALHLLREDDLFVDVGANVGVYSVLAGGACGARTIACEPIGQALRDLRRNVALNDLGNRVEIRNCAVGAAPGTVRMTDDSDTMNRVVEGASGGGVDVPVMTLDAILDGRTPTLIKIDVEGYEEQVLAGAEATLRASSLRAVTLEAGPFDADGGARRRRLCASMKAFGFEPAEYDAVGRRLTPMRDVDRRGDDIVFVRDLAALQAILTAAPRRNILNTTI